MECMLSISSLGPSFKVYASPYTPEFWRLGIPGQDKRRQIQSGIGKPPDETLNIATDNSIIPPVDIVMTHGPAKYIDDTPSDSAGSDLDIYDGRSAAHNRGSFDLVTSTPRTEARRIRYATTPDAKTADDIILYPKCQQ